MTRWMLVALVFLLILTPVADAETPPTHDRESASEKAVKEPATPDVADTASSTSAPQGAKPAEIALDFGLGAGGFISKGGESAALLLTTQLAYCLTESWQLGLAWDAKLQPWEPGNSFFHTLGAGVRWRFFRGLYADARLGPAFSYLREGDFQQARYGVGWGMRLGYAWTPGVVGLNAAAVVNMRHIHSLYTDVGAVLGLQLML